MLMLSTLLEAFDCSKPGLSDFILTDAEIDSRKIIPGSLFIAVVGERVDGHDYVDEAFQRGASAALIQHDIPSAVPVIDLSKPGAINAIPVASPICIKVDNTVSALQRLAAFWRSKLSIKTIGITGSVGKSSTKELVAEVLSTHYSTMKNTGNMNNELGLPLTLLKLTEGYERAVLEMGFYKQGEIAHLCEIAHPHTGIITNIGTVHAERCGSKESIAKGKAELVEALPADGIAILNYDDEWVRPMAQKTRARVLYYGLNPAAEVWADKIVSRGMYGIQFQIHYQKNDLLINVPLLGEHSVHTSLCAIAAGLADGLNWGEIISGLQSHTTQLRLVPGKTKNGAIILDDSYNASPESSLAALNLLNTLDGRKIAVLGDMKELGNYAESEHRKVGVRAAQIVDYLFTVGELGLIISNAAKESGFPQDRVFEALDPMPVIEALKGLLKSGDIVLIKGSHSMRLDQIVAALEEES